MAWQKGKPRPPNAGRRKGALNKRTLAKSAAVQHAREVIQESIPDAFPGDAHALMIAIYKDPSHPMDIRLEAATKAAPYEKPALARQEVTGKDGGPLTVKLERDDSAV